MKRVLLAGASGLIGRHLVPFLEKKGFIVDALQRKHQGAFFWDPEKGVIDSESLNGYQAIICLSGHPVFCYWTKKNREKILRSRVDSVSCLVNAIKTLPTPPELFLSASAIGFYGNREDEILSETSSKGDGFLAETAFQWEEASKKAPSRSIQLRLGLVLADDGGILHTMKKPFQFGLGGKLGSGEQWMSWVAIADVLSIIETCIEDKRLSGPINAVSPEPRKNKDFTKDVAKSLHRPSFCHVPSFFLRAILGKQADEMLLASTRVIPEKILQTGYQFKYKKLEDALGGYLPKS